MTTYRYEDIFEEIPGDADHIMMRIPPEICEAQGWQEGDVLCIKVRDGALVISKKTDH
jgi:antitoxin component of MazEF toxin-antitoxin module